MTRESEGERITYKYYIMLKEQMRKIAKKKSNKKIHRKV
jgi:hypothetical protein